MSTFVFNGFSCLGSSLVPYFNVSTKVATPKLRYVRFMEALVAEASFFFSVLSAFRYFIFL